jgi:hypothetical protein
MKLLKTSVFLLVILGGVYLSYLAFLAFDSQDSSNMLLYLSLSLLLICIGLVSLFMTLNPKPPKKSMEYAVQPTVSDPRSANESEMSESVEPRVDLSFSGDLTPVEMKEEPMEDASSHPEDEKQQETTEKPEIKEDPTFLFEDWWVDEFGLYTDTRLIGFTGRKQQKILRKMPQNAELTYHINHKNANIEILYEKVVVGIIPELFQHSILIYIQGIEKITVASIVKKGRDVVHFEIRVRFNDELRERLQKKLQQNDWRHYP